MPLDSPPIRQQLTFLADWLEFSALASRKGHAFVKEVSGELDIDQDQQEEDWAEEDASKESLVDKVTTKIKDRAAALGSSYPFALSKDGAILNLTDVDNFGKVSYLYCLIMSHAIDSACLNGDVLPDTSNRSRDLFQVCATLCAAGSVEGPGVSFGWPRPDRTTVLEKLQQIAHRTGGVPRRAVLALWGKYVKDDEIDVIAWRDEAHGHPPSLYLLGQSASGKNWRGKSIRNAVDNVFHQTWYEVPPPIQPNPAIFIPFAPDEEEEIPFAPGGVVWRDNLELGTLYSRYNLPKYANTALALQEAGIGPIERVGDVGDVANWVTEFRERLIAAAV